MCTISAVALGGVGASAANDEPDLVPFVGGYAVGCSWDNGCGGGHHGAATPALDFPMPEGVPIVAANTGIAALWEDSCAGRYIEVWHSGVRKYSRYLHLTSFAVREGDRVERGQIIGYSGNTGSDCSTGPHLHYDDLDEYRSKRSCYERWKPTRILASIFDCGPVSPASIRMSAASRPTRVKSSHTMRS